MPRGRCFPALVKLAVCTVSPPRYVHHEAFRAAAHLPTVIAGDYNDWRDTLDGVIFTRHSFRQATSPLKQFRSARR